jgi:RND family efflux transporter MFP subunit
LAQARSALARLKLQYASDESRAATLARSRDLARAEFERLQTLFKQDEVGTRSGVEQAERAYNQAQDQLDLMRHTLDTYPAQLEEAESAIAAAEARLQQARIDLERTVVNAPFDARLKEVAVETGQFVTPGAHAVTIANDAVLELSVPLNSREAQNWLRFEERAPGRDEAWFAALEPVDVRIEWTEDDQHSWTGTLHRVEAFDPETRTLTVAVRVAGDQALSADEDALPLVDGMFCRVVIPGKAMEQVYRLPRAAVTFDGNVYLAADGRLKTQPVELVNEQDGYAFVGDGLQPGDDVIVTRLVDPLENTLLDVTNPDPPVTPGEPVELPAEETRT